jgi:hypothetical protein
MSEVGGVLNDQEIVAVAAEQVVDTRTGDERIVPGATDQDVVASIATSCRRRCRPDVVVVGTAGQYVLPSPPLRTMSAGAIDRIVAVRADD